MIKISININLGNDAMLSDADVSDTLGVVASRFIKNGYIGTVDTEQCDISRGIMDSNGNTIGDFTVSYIGN